MSKNSGTLYAELVAANEIITKCFVTVPGTLQTHCLHSFSRQTISTGLFDKLNWDSAMLDIQNR